MTALGTGHRIPASKWSCKIPACLPLPKPFLGLLLSHPARGWWAGKGTQIGGWLCHCPHPHPTAGWHRRSRAHVSGSGTRLCPRVPEGREDAVTAGGLARGARVPAMKGAGGALAAVAAPRREQLAELNSSQISVSRPSCSSGLSLSHLKLTPSQGGEVTCTSRASFSWASPPLPQFPCP